MEDDQLVRQLWVAVEGLFLANKVPSAVFLREEFSSMKHGLSPSMTCHRMKTVQRSVSLLQPVLNLLRGLNPRFSNTTDNIADTTLLPD